MSNLDTAVQIIAQHTGGWTRNDKGEVVCRGWDCGHKPTIGEFHGLHVAKILLATFGVPE